jgi:hypothetical protein
MSFLIYFKNSIQIYLNFDLSLVRIGLINEFDSSLRPK